MPGLFGSNTGGTLFGGAQKQETDSGEAII